MVPVAGQQLSQAEVPVGRPRQGRRWKVLWDQAGCQLPRLPAPGHREEQGMEELGLSEASGGLSPTLCQ